MPQSLDDLRAIVPSGSWNRYRTYQVVVVVVYLMLVALSALYVVTESHTRREQEGGFQVAGTYDELLNNTNLSVVNHSNTRYINLLIKVDELYCFEVETIESQGRITLKMSELDYVYYLPGTWLQRHGWRPLFQDPIPQRKAPEDYQPENLVIETGERSLSFDL